MDQARLRHRKLNLGCETNDYRTQSAQPEPQTSYSSKYHFRSPHYALPISSLSFHLLIIPYPHLSLILIFFILPSSSSSFFPLILIIIVLSPHPHHSLSSSSSFPLLLILLIPSPHPHCSLPSTSSFPSAHPSPLLYHRCLYCLLCTVAHPILLPSSPLLQLRLANSYAYR